LKYPTLWSTAANSQPTAAAAHLVVDALSVVFINQFPRIVKFTNSPIVKCATITHPNSLVSGEQMTEMLLAKDYHVIEAVLPGRSINLSVARSRMSIAVRRRINAAPQAPSRSRMI
jgi:hypothetical protein